MHLHKHQAIRVHRLIQDTSCLLRAYPNNIYPPEHRQMAAKMIKQGAIISDYAPGTPPDSTNFPPRNRIISGISLATVIVEAGEKSGALITAAFAADQGREVFALPGNINAPQSKGANKLIQQGASPLLHVEDLLDVLQIDHVHEYQQARLVLPADEVEKALLKSIQNEALHVDEISALVNIPIDKVTAALVIMELKGMVRQEREMSYIAVFEEGGEYSSV